MPYTPNNPYLPGDPYSYDLKWVVAEIKKAIEEYNTLHGYYDALIADFADLKNYVDNYFNNLDLSSEVEAVINRMRQQGYFDILITDIVNDSGLIESTTEAWLASHIGPTTPPIDTSLSIAGAAADAKAVGDRFTLSDEISDMMITTKELPLAGYPQDEILTSTFSGFESIGTFSELTVASTVTAVLRLTTGTPTHVRLRMSTKDYDDPAFTSSIFFDGTQNITPGSDNNFITFDFGRRIFNANEKIYMYWQADDVCAWMFGPETHSSPFHYWINGDMSDTTTRSGVYNKMFTYVHSIIPDKKIKVSDISSSELVTSGNNLLNLADVMRNTNYSVNLEGAYSSVAANHYISLVFDADLFTSGYCSVQALNGTATDYLSRYIVGNDLGSVYDSVYYSATTPLSTGASFAVDPDASKVIITILPLSTSLDDLQLMISNSSSPMVYDTGNSYILKDLALNEERPYLTAPKQYELVVGDTFELFFNGIVVAPGNDYYIELSCDIGHHYRRKYMVNPTATQVGSHPLSITLFDGNHNKCDSAVIDLVVKAVATQPVAPITILYVGDSLAVNGEAPHEFKRRLTESGGTPAGNGYSNIYFVGQVNDGYVDYQAAGGYSFYTYNHASTPGTPNPFWYNGAVDFSAYASDVGASTIDYLYVLLGWNSNSANDTSIENEVNTFCNNVHASFPNCKIVLMSIEMPSFDGMGANYVNRTGVLNDYYTAKQFVDRTNRIYENYADSHTNVSFVNVSGQFDTEYNMPAAASRVNTRNATTVTQQNNGIHPDLPGFLQIADAAWRDFQHKI